jgi:hypothetical protein
MPGARVDTDDELLSIPEGEVWGDASLERKRERRGRSNDGSPCLCLSLGASDKRRARLWGPVEGWRGQR